MPLRHYQQILRVMRLTTFLLTLCILQVSAATLAQKITLSVKDAPLAAVIEQLRSQSGYDFMITTSLLKSANPVNLQAKEQELPVVLERLFADQPLNFRIQDRSVVISKKGTSFFERLKSAFTAIDVHGTVLDENGRPLPGVGIRLQDNSQATVTDLKGEFTLRRVEENALILVSFIGYQPFQTPVKTDLGKIRLQLATSRLDEVQVIAYGKTSKRYATGNITTISAQEIAKSPVSNPLAALQGRVPGLNIQQSSGYSNSAFVTMIQGQNSMTKGNDPFYVIDGVPYPQQNLSITATVLGVGGTNTQGKGSPLSFINPADIESISILKDADATAIYGSRAANGAILITTKKGKQGKVKLGVDYDQGISQVGRYMPLMNTTQYLAMRHEAIRNSKTTVKSTDYDINGLWDTTRNTNWQKELLGKDGHYTNLNASVSGGSSTAQYLLGGTYHRETTVLPTDLGDQKASMHFSLNTNTEDNKFQIQFSGSYLVDNNKLPTSDLAAQAMTLAPDAPVLRNPDGSLNFAFTSAGRSTFNNPLLKLNNGFDQQTHNLVSNLVLNYAFLPGLNLKANFGYTNMQTDEVRTFPLTSYRPDLAPFNTRSGYYGKYNLETWIAEPQLTYNRTLGHGVLDLLLGSSVTRNNSKGNEVMGSGYNTDEAIADMNSAAHLSSVQANAAVYKYAGIFGRANYIFKDKYILTASARRDGSSRFGPASQFHNFAALGAGWIFSEEQFVKGKLPFLSFGKLRFSYGTTGNDNIGDYQFMNLYYPVSAEVPYRGITGLYSSGVYDPSLHWELTKKTSFGLDLGFFKDRLLLTANYNINRSSSQLLPYYLPSITGVSSVVTNFPATVQNTGLELTANADIIKSEKFGWTANFNLTVPRNKLIAFENLESSSYANDFVIGQSVNSMRLYKFAGVNPQTGAYQFEDHNGQLTAQPDPQTDRIVYKDLMPKFYGGIGTGFRFASLSVDLQFQFMNRNGLNYFSGNPSAYPGAPLFNQPAYLTDRWTQPGSVSVHQRYDATGAFADTWSTTKLLADASYVGTSYCRLKNASVSWTVPAGLLSHTGISSARVYAKGQNLLTFTNYQGPDPETLSYSTLPPLRTIVLGVQLGL